MIAFVRNAFGFLLADKSKNNNLVSAYFGVFPSLLQIITNPFLLKRQL